MTSPSHYRREGRNAFYRGGDPIASNPYKIGSANACYWLDGWEEAKRDDILAQEREAQEEIEEEAKLDEFVRLYNLAKDRGLIS